MTPAAFADAGGKVWYYHKVVYHVYAMALLALQKLFQLGLREMFHHQPSMYYKALLHMLENGDADRVNSVRPWQPHAYYAVLIQRQDVGRPRANLDIEVEQRGRTSQYQLTANCFSFFLFYSIHINY